MLQKYLLQPVRGILSYFQSCMIFDCYIGILSAVDSTWTLTFPNLWRYHLIKTCRSYGIKYALWHVKCAHDKNKYEAFCTQLIITCEICTRWYQNGKLLHTLWLCVTFYKYQRENVGSQISFIKWHRTCYILPEDSTSTSLWTPRPASAQVSDSPVY